MTHTHPDDERSATLLASQQAVEATEAAVKVSVDTFVPALIPGPLQAPGYSRHVLSAAGLRGEDLDEAVLVRMDRSDYLSRHRCRFVITPAALHLDHLPDRAQHMQRGLLTLFADRPTVDLRVLPTDAGVPWYGGFTIVDGRHVQMETPTGRLIVPDTYLAGYRDQFEALFAAAQPYHP
ncbi:Scr1 family TA system antitoxin-like transcriptional regulator [Nocardiopsis sp. NPDC006139]|uniref:Scr1 family TA system antitoxin-like transcriptional regulator n=1 Tax=Nocardiopsis sp. NPDC006139 TaxID=3154578 RepID=UPI0033BE804E